MFLECFPLRDQVADFPHQRLVAIGEWPGRLEVFVETGRGHGRLELLDLRLALGNARFEVRDALLKGVDSALALSPLGFLALAGFARFRPGSGIRLAPSGVEGDPRSGGLRDLLGFGFWDLGFGIFPRFSLVLLTPQKLGVGTWIDQSVPVPDLDDLRRQLLDEVAVVRDQDQRAAVI